MTPLASKLVRLMLDKAATLAEAESAAVKLVRHLRAEGISADELLAPAPRLPGLQNDVLPFGQYRGIRIADVAREDAGYLRWLLLHVRLRRGLREAIKSALATVQP